MVVPHTTYSRNVNVMKRRETGALPGFEMGGGGQPSEEEPFL